MARIERGEVEYEHDPDDDVEDEEYEPEEYDDE